MFSSEVKQLNVEAEPSDSLAGEEQMSDVSSECLEAALCVLDSGDEQFDEGGESSPHQASMEGLRVFDVRLRQSS